MLMFVKALFLSCFSSIVVANRLSRFAPFESYSGSHRRNDLKFFAIYTISYAKNSNFIR